MSSSRTAGAPLLQRWQFGALLLATVLGATLLIASLLWTARQDALRAAQVTALNYARTMEVRMETTFRRTDSILHTLAQMTPLEALAPHGEDRHAARLNGELDALLRSFDELIALRIVDAAGDQRYVSSAGTTPAVNYADRSFFTTYRSDVNAGLLFSEVVTGRVSKQPTMVISLPLRDAQLRLRGAVLAPLDLSFFQQQFKKLDIGRNGAVFLRRSEAGALVLRWPQIDAEVNRPMPPDQPILRAVRAGREESVHEYVAFTDGVPRISGTVVVKGYPFFLTVALSQDDVLAGWRRLALLTGLTWALLLALTITLLLRLRRSSGERLALETQLREAQRIESLGTLAGGIAHDFNNILAAILGNVALARREISADHPAQRSLEQIGKASSRARDLVQQILAFGRRQRHVLVSQPLQPLVEEAQALLRPLLPAEVVLDSMLPPEPLCASVDAAQMQQVLMNLCTNAWHALQGQPGRIGIGLAPVDIDTHTVLAPGRYAHLWVQDSGAGMAPSTLARIFEPFFTTKPTGQGTGLGLPVVHGIVLAHGGAIDIESQPGAGTTVHLYFRATACDAVLPAAEAPPATTATDTTQAVAAGRGEHVLYIDDDEFMALMVERLLVQAGYRVTACGDGAAGLAALRAAPASFDLVVTDYNMPGLDGLDVAREVARVRADLPVVISSGYIAETLREQAAAAGVRHLLHKQHTLEDLPALVDELLHPR